MADAFPLHRKPRANDGKAKIMATIPEDRPISSPTNAAGDGVVTSETEASQGQKTGHIRWVLRLSVVLAVLAMAGVWLWSSQTSHGVAPSQLVSPSGAAPASGQPT
jgi:hypothetical protein